jgi:hypothetical protein
MIDKSKVWITEIAPDADQLSKLDPKKLAQLLVKYSERHLKAKQNRQRGAEKSRDRKDTQRKKTIALDIANWLKRQEPRLRLSRTDNRLAGRIRALWPKQEGPPPSQRTIRRWLSLKK